MGQRRPARLRAALPARRRRAVASPIPEPAPVTSARRPAIRPSRAAPSAEPDTAVDPDRLPGDVAGVAGKQPCDRTGAVRAGAVPAQWHARDDKLHLMLKRRA